MTSGDRLSAIVVTYLFLTCISIVIAISHYQLEYLKIQHHCEQGKKIIESLENKKP